MPVCGSPADCLRRDSILKAGHCGAGQPFCNMVMLDNLQTVYNIDMQPDASIGMIYV